MISKKKIKIRIGKKTNSELVETLMLAKKNKLLGLVTKLSTPRRNMPALNLEDIEKQSKDNESVLIPGKVLGNGELKKKVKIIALSFSSSAEEKLKKAKIETATIREEIEKNKTLKNVRILG